MHRDHKQLLGSAAAIVALIAFVTYGHYAITELTTFFVEARKSESKFFFEMVRDNWDGIKTISDEKKKVLLENLDPVFAGADIEAMGLIARILIYLIGAGFALDRVIAIGKVLVTRKRHNTLLKPTR
jgi:hypothetical protein